MGEIADYYFDIAMQAEGELGAMIEKRESYYIKGIHEDIDGKQHLIKNMQTDHLMNTVNCFNIDDREHPLRIELKKRGYTY